MADFDILSDKIRSIRRSLNMSQVELAEKSGVSVNSIRLCEGGKVQPRIETIIKIAGALGVRIEDLTGLETFDTGADFDKRRKELLSQAKAAGDRADRLTIIHTKDPRKFIDFALDQMNEEGRAKVAERAAEVLEVPKYRKDAPKD